MSSRSAPRAPRPRKASKARTAHDVRLTPAGVSSAALDRVFSALGHASRRRILISLHGRGGAMTAGEIADRFKHSWPTTTRHLSVLEDAGLLKVRKQGRNRVYTLCPRMLVRVTDWLYGWSAVSDVDTEATTGERPAWTALPYASMRNAIPPKQGKLLPVHDD